MRTSLLSSRFRIAVLAIAAAGVLNAAAFAQEARAGAAPLQPASNPSASGRYVTSYLDLHPKVKALIVTDTLTGEARIVFSGYQTPDGRHGYTSYFGRPFVDLPNDQRPGDETHVTLAQLLGFVGEWNRETIPTTPGTAK